MTLPFKTRHLPSSWKTRSSPATRARRGPRSDAAADGGRGRPQRGGGTAVEVRRFPGGDGSQWQLPQLRDGSCSQMRGGEKV